MQAKEGHIAVGGFKLFYRTFGTGETNLLCLHGGPGLSHGYLLPLAKLADERLSVVLYDQLGCGKSQRPNLGAMEELQSCFNIEYATEEVEGVRSALGLQRIILLGHSYGGQLALQYALKYQEHMAGLVLTGAYASVPEAVAEMGRLKKRLPAKTRTTLAKYESLWAFQSPDYVRALNAYYRSFFCRIHPWPRELKRVLDEINLPIHWAMNGVDELAIRGNLREWDITDRLHEIHVPTLITSGKYDLITPKLARRIGREIAGSRLVIFRKSSHFPMWEEQSLYLKTLNDFLTAKP